MLLERRGTALAIFSGLLYGLLGYFGASLLESGLSAPNVSFWRFFVAFLLVCLLFLLSGKKNKLTNASLKMLLIGSVFYSVPSSLFLVASRHIGTGQAMVIFFIFPVFVMLFNWLFLHQHLKIRYVISFVIILIGMLFLVDIGEVKTDLLGIALSLLAAMLYGGYIFLSKNISLQPMNSTLMVLCGCAMSSGVFAIIDGSLNMPTASVDWLYILLYGVICSALPILFMLQAMKYIGSDKAAILSVLEPLFTVFFGVILLDEPLSLTMLIGVALILCGVLAVLIDPRKAMSFKLKISKV